MLEQGRRYVVQDIPWDPFPTMAIDSAAALLLIAFMLIGCWLSFIPNSFSLACDSLVTSAHDAASSGSNASYLRAAQDDDDGEGDPKIISLIRSR
jgi:hypothetical protein